MKHLFKINLQMDLSPVAFVVDAVEVEKFDQLAVRRTTGHPQIGSVAVGAAVVGIDGKLVAERWVAVGQTEQMNQTSP